MNAKPSPENARGEPANRPSVRSGCWQPFLRLLAIPVLALVGLVVYWTMRSSLGGEEEAIAQPDPPATRIVLSDEQSLAPGEYRAAFRLALAGESQDFRQDVLSQGAARITIKATDAAFVPSQVLSRGDFPSSGHFQDLSAYFYVEKPA